MITSKVGGYESEVPIEIISELGEIADAEYYRRIGRVGLDTYLDSANIWNVENITIQGTEVIEAMSPRIVHYFIPIGRGRYEWWKFY